jgi:hypothetical protein
LVPALVVGAALVLVALAARGNSPVLYDARRSVDEAVNGQVLTGPSEFRDDGASNLIGGSFVVLLIVLFGLFLFGLVGLVIALVGPRRRRGARRWDVAVEASDQEFQAHQGSDFLLAGAKSALVELRERTAGPPSDAVVAAWLRLEQAAADSGAPRQDHQTPTEFTGDLLVRYEVDTAATSTLRRLYQRARFGPPDQVSTDDADAATEALEHIVADLGRR